MEVPNETKVSGGFSRSHVWDITVLAVQRGDIGFLVEFLDEEEICVNLCIGHAKQLVM